jgi:hypothetical protein
VASLRHTRGDQSSNGRLGGHGEPRARGLDRVGDLQQQLLADRQIGVPVRLVHVGEDLDLEGVLAELLEGFATDASTLVAGCCDDNDRAGAAAFRKGSFRSGWPIRVFLGGNS